MALLLSLMICLTVFLLCNKRADTLPPQNIYYKDIRGDLNVLISSEKDKNRYWSYEEEFGVDIYSKDVYTVLIDKTQIYSQLFRHGVIPVFTIVNNFEEEVRTKTLAGDCKYDLLLGTLREMIPLGNEKHLIDLYSIEDYPEDKFVYDKGYVSGWSFFHYPNGSLWDENISGQVETNGKLYFTKNSYTMDDMAYVMWYSPTLFDQSCLTTPKMYIEKNQWTLDTWKVLIKSLNNPTVEERWGSMEMLYSPEDNKAFLVGAGLNTAEYAAGKYTLGNAWTSDIEKTKAVFQECRDVFSSENSICLNDEESIFYNIPFMFCGYLPAEMKSIPTDSAIKIPQTELTHYIPAPFPKYDEKQGEYYSLVPENALYLAIPSNANDPYRVVCALDILNDGDNNGDKVVKLMEYDVPKDYLCMVYNTRKIDFGLSNDFGGMRSKVLDVDIRTNDIIQNYKDNEKAILDSMKE